MQEQPRPTAGELSDHIIKAAAYLGAAVFLACLIGIATRPAGFLASLWPANAVMLGFLLRIPAAAHPVGWLSAGVAYMSADMLTGGTFFKSLILNGANLISVGTAYWVYLKLPLRVALLRDPASMLYMVLASAVAASAAGAAGALINPFMFGGSALHGWAYWFTTEFVNYIAILPVLLSAPSIRESAQWCTFSKKPRSLIFLAPIAALILSFALAVLVGGIGAIAFAVPALLWCGLTYTIFPTAMLTLLFGSWTLIAIATGLLPNPNVPSDELAAISARLGISLIAIAPIMLATVMGGRNELLSRMQHLATRDTLTGSLNRGAFFEKATEELTEADTIGALMIDIDYFKHVNDTYGHATGDEVLVACVQRMQRCLRNEDIFGRLGGEEFAILSRAQSVQELSAVAERIRCAISKSPVATSGGRQATITVSIGIAFAHPPHPGSALGDMLAEADHALYTAKQQGRNRVVIASA